MLDTPAFALDAAAPTARYPYRRETPPRAPWREALDAMRGAWSLGEREDRARAMRCADAVMRVDRGVAQRALAQRRALGTALVGARRGSAAREQALVHAFAALGEASRSALGLVPHRAQWMAARLLLDGRCVEMATGEGKTLAVAIAAGVAALEGWRVHVMTANDYLAGRDARSLAAMLDHFGLRVATVTVNVDEAARRDAYAADVTVATAREIAFDWMRDRVRFGAVADDLALELCAGGAMPVMRGLPMALVDEADAVLLDEARTPFVLAAPAPDVHADDDAVALACARRCRDGRDFVRSNDTIALTDAGRAVCAAAAAAHGATGLWRHAAYRDERVTLALVALHAIERDRAYVVRDGRVHIVDPHTGRIAHGRAWSRGLHRLIERKEGLAPQAPSHTLASITLPRLLGRYLRRAGTTATAHAARAELRAMYGWRTVRIPLRTASRRIVRAPVIRPDTLSQHAATVARVTTLVAAGRPVLVATADVAASHALSDALVRAGIDHALLNALHDADEARIVARAGERGRVTVSTAMAGRGTDIVLGEGVGTLGGLAVIRTFVAPSQRIDQQLAGRAARQGDPGSAEAVLSADDRVLADRLSTLERNALRRCAASTWPPMHALARALVRLAQRRQEAHDADTRRLARWRDGDVDAALAFAPRSALDRR